MAAILGPNDKMAGIVGAAHGERAINWAQLSEDYRTIAGQLHFFALGEYPKSSSDIGPIYVRQALAMQKKGVKLNERW